MIIVGLLWTLSQYWLLRQCPNPTGSAPGFYQQLVTRTGAVQVGAVSLGALLIARLAPQSSWPMWWVLATTFTLLVWIDFRTMFLPKIVQISGCIQLGIAMLVGYQVLGLTNRDVVQAIVTAMVTTLLFWIIWRLSNGALGFGDVRLAGSLSLVSAANSQQIWMVAILSSAVIGAGWGLVGAKKSHTFPYGPALYLGTFASLLWDRFIDW